VKHIENIKVESEISAVPQWHKTGRVGRLEQANLQTPRSICKGQSEPCRATGHTEHPQKTPAAEQDDSLGSAQVVCNVGSSTFTGFLLWVINSAGQGTSSTSPQLNIGSIPHTGFLTHRVLIMVIWVLDAWIFNH
jgi:hypothetical protein